MKRQRFIWLLLLIGGLAGAKMQILPVTELGTQKLTGWEEKSFQGRTLYTPMTVDNRPALKAESMAAASGLVKKIKVDLNKTPMLNWSWKVEQHLGGLDETTQDGDDYAARIYVIASGGLFFWQTRALNYVWSSNQPQGAAWPNPFTENAQMIAVQGRNGKLGMWQMETRNVYEDFRHYFGVEIDEVDAVAIMTDTDNSGRHTVAYYGDIFFAPERPVPYIKFKE